MCTRLLLAITKPGGYIHYSTLLSTMKNLVLTASFVAAFSLCAQVAYAQDTSTDAAKGDSTKPVSAVNPFTGKSLQLEQIQKELEASRLRTQLLEESLKQTNIKEEMATVPLRKAVEAAQAKTNIRKEEAAYVAVEAGVKDQKVKQTKQSAKAAADKEAQMRADIEAKVRKEYATKEAQAPVVRMPTLMSVLVVGQSRSVVLDFDGNTMVAADGTATPAGPVAIRDDQSAYVGGRLFTVRDSTLGRFVVSDPKAVAKPATEAPKAATVLVSSDSAKTFNTGTPLPTLQLPPGLPPLPGTK